MSNLRRLLHLIWRKLVLFIVLLEYTRVVQYCLRINRPCLRRLDLRRFKLTQILVPDKVGERCKACW